MARTQRISAPNPACTLNGIRAIRRANSVRGKQMVRNEESRALVGVKPATTRSLNYRKTDGTLARVWIPGRDNPDAGGKVVL